MPLKSLVRTTSPVVSFDNIVDSVDERIRRETVKTRIKIIVKSVLNELVII